MTTETNKLVTFRLGEDHFAADIFSVERVLRYAVPTPVPDMPAYIEGVIDYQGRVMPVVNLRLRFELPKVDAVAILAALFDQAARMRPSCVNAVTPSSRPISSAILPFSTRRTVVPVNRIFPPEPGGSEP